tara:strand:- start:161 stop:400 length:240 start_codon:yes stop_codon:yes gene_type:complete
MNDVNSQNNGKSEYPYTKEFLDSKVQVQGFTEGKYDTMTIRELLDSLNVPTECTAHMFYKNSLRAILNRAIRDFKTSRV